MLVTLLTVALPLLVIYLYRQVYHKRYIQFKDFPQMPTSLALGHLALFDEFTKQGALDRHPDEIYNSMRETIGRPPIALFDLRPVHPPVVLLSTHEAAEQISRATTQFPTSLPKTDLSSLRHVFGNNSILSAEGEEWKSLRKRFQPGFAPQHLSSLMPSIIDKTLLFVRHLEDFVRAGEDVSLLPYLVDVTFDIIGIVVMDFDFHAQGDAHERSEIIKLFLELLSTYWDEKTAFPWWMNPRLEFKRRRLGERVHHLIGEVVQERYLEYTNHRRHDSRPTIIDLSFQGTTELTPELLSVTCDQVQTFLLAGHDTVSTTLAWIFYELHRTPRVLKTAREELDQVLGPETDPESIGRSLRDPKQSDNVLNKLPYLSAVIKESLRLHPPSATARIAPQGSSFALKNQGRKDIIADGTVMYNCVANIQRDPAVYGDTCNSFVPERWLSSGNGGDGTEPSEIPAGAWRPFERGPRNCIGQHFALMEVRAMLVMIVRKFDFIKVGIGALALDKSHRPIMGDNGQYRVKSELYNTRQINPKPVDGMTVKVRLAMTSESQ